MKKEFQTNNSAEFLALLYREYNKFELPLPTFIVYNGFDDRTCRDLDAGGLLWKVELDLHCDPEQMEARGLVTGLDVKDVPEFPGAYWMGDAVCFLLGDGRWLYAEAIFDGPC